MIDSSFHTHSEEYGGSTLEWSNRVDHAGSRIEWRITTDNRGWVSRYGSVHNDGVSFGSRAISSASDEKELLLVLRERVRAASGQMADHVARNTLAA